MKPESAAARPASNLLLLAGVLLIAANLRPALASVSPVLAPIGAAFGLGGFGLTALATIPVLCFAALAPASLPLQRRLGLEAAMLAILAALILGLVVRLAGSVAALFGGTVLAGSAIAMANVLLPAIVKRDFAGKAGLATGLYTTVLNGAAAAAAGFSVPLARLGHFGWRAALGVWAVPALAALVLWLPQLGHGAHRPVLPRIPGGFVRLARAKLAWAVALFMGLQSLGYYAVLSWLPAILQSVGIAPAKAGLMLSATTIVAIPISLVTPGLATRGVDQRKLLAGILVGTAIGYLGLTVAPGAAPWLWVIIIGLGQGALFPLALMLIVLRAGGLAEAMALSAFSQTVGYAVSILGPLGLGLIHGATGAWWPATACLAATMIPALIAGLAAARNRTIRF
ncbi:MAG: MFS transporter [Acidiphilium sp.]